MTERIKQKFLDLKSKNEKALVIYLTAGDPDMEMTYRLVLGLQSAGADIVEIGVPFSDPTADGPIIQAASQRALRKGATLSAIFDMIKSLRHVSDIPIVLFGYYNPIFSFGGEAFAETSHKAGVDGILVVDLPPEESYELRQYTDHKGLDFISLIAPTTSTDRIKIISKDAQGFLYYISITGVTGTTQPHAVDIEKDVAKIREITSLPLVIGFGISTPQQAGKIASYADGVVIGSAFVSMLEKNCRKKDLLKTVSSYVKSIKKELK